MSIYGIHYDIYKKISLISDKQIQRKVHGMVIRLVEDEIYYQFENILRGEVYSQICDPLVTWDD